MSTKALGLIETVGLTTAIEAADAAVKSANVQLLGYELTRGNGMVTVKLVGDVGAVQAAVSAGVTSARRIGEIYSQLVIPRPHEGIETLIGQVDRGPAYHDGRETPMTIGSGEVAAKPVVEASAPEALPRKRCIGTTISGEPCRNMARPGSDYCHIHQPKAETEDAVEDTGDVEDTREVEEDVQPPAAATVPPEVAFYDESGEEEE